MPDSPSDLIFIVGRQRSGTTVLRHLLARHGALDAGEIFHSNLHLKHRFYAFVGERAMEDRSFIHPTRHRELFLEFIANLRRESAGGPIAIDVKYSFLNSIGLPWPSAGRPHIVRFMREVNAQVFNVVRQNKLRALVSEKMALANGVWWAGKPEDLPSDKCALKLNVDETLRRLSQLEQEDRQASTLLSGVPHCRTLYYEAMFREDGVFADEVVKCVAAVLQREPINPRPTDLPTNPEPLSELIENFSEIAEALRGTPFHWMSQEAHHDGQDKPELRSAAEM